MHVFARPFPPVSSFVGQIAFGGYQFYLYYPHKSRATWLFWPRTDRSWRCRFFAHLYRAAAYLWFGRVVVGLAASCQPLAGYAAIRGPLGRQLDEEECAQLELSNTI